MEDKKVIKSSEIVIDYKGVTITLENLLSVLMISTGTGTERFSTFVEAAIRNREEASANKEEQPEEQPAVSE